ncbi:Sensor protein kinase WalK [Acetatifactor muris]|uniref:histidine kinase n=1 Tax=Acetatifactor muris TaxID=879566 RepID=A0A2K4ZK01_9FIRM|nr:HAMP domain-containing sensor histidine kinase [Acetatifactor muris]SOY30736.1 Sensor protein kinase WalK [Acetatifactor muris]
MNIRNTLRQSGGADIKLKVNPKIKRFVITLLLIAGGLLLCQFAYVLIDYVMNGFVLDWFDRNYVYYEWVPLRDGQDGCYSQHIVWWKLKDLVFKFSVGLAVFLIVTVRLITIVYASRQEKKCIQTIGRLISDYMKHDREVSEVFPENYAPVSAQMAEIKAAIQRQEQLQKEEAGRKNDLITYLAHDLKTPLTSVVGYLSLLDEAPDMPEPQKEKYVHITLDKAQQLEKLINEFFEITRYNLQQIVLEKESVDLAFMLVQMTDEFYPVLCARGNAIRLEWQTEEEESGEGRQAEDIFFVYADPEKLARVFNNILKNAIAYSYPDTEILVTCRAEAEYVSITFANRGKTIPAQKLDAIFEKFFRLDDARSTNNGGAGLGLAIARDIVTLHRGTITADSADEVTTFTVKIPNLV